MKIEKSGFTLNAGKSFKKKYFRQHLRKFGQSNCDKDRLGYSQKRREYKEPLRHKKQSHKNNILQSVQTNIKKKN